MRISTTARDVSTTLHIHCTRIDAAIAQDVRASLGEAVAAVTGEVVVDLSEVTFLDSAGLGALIGAFKAAGERRVSLCAVQPAVRTVLRLTRLDRAFPIID